MKKIYFNDTYGLTQAVIEGKKTQIRIPVRFQTLSFSDRILCLNTGGYLHEAHQSSPYCVGDRVAIAMSYKDLMPYKSIGEFANMIANYQETKGWANRMFAKADCLPQIIITKVEIERLQDISRQDMFAEGMEETDKGYIFPYAADKVYRTPIDGIKTLYAEHWIYNPWVFKIEFCYLAFRDFRCKLRGIYKHIRIDFSENSDKTTLEQWRKLREKYKKTDVNTFETENAKWILDFPTSRKYQIVVLSKEDKATATKLLNEYLNI